MDAVSTVVNQVAGQHSQQGFVFKNEQNEIVSSF